MQDDSRTLVSRWLDQSGLTKAEIARRAHIPKSVITRFLSGSTLTPLNAARLLSTICPDLSVAEVNLLVSDFGLRQFEHLSENCRFPEHSVSTATNKVSPHTHAAALLTDAYNTLDRGGQHAQNRASQLFFLAEEAFAQDYWSALSAARAGTQMLINIGDLDAAECQCARIEATYSRRLTEAASPILRSLRGWILFDKCDYDAASMLFRQNLEAGKRYDLQEIVNDSVHMLCLVHLYKAMSQQTGIAQTKMLDIAESYGRLWLRTITNSPTADINYAFIHFRLGQIEALQSRARELTPEHIRLAQRYFSNEPTRHFVSTFVADRLLEDGITTKASDLAAQAIDEFESIQYPMGMAQCSRIRATAALQDGKLEKALQDTLLSLALNPWGQFGPTTVEDLLRDIVQQLFSQYPAKRVEDIIETTWERMHCRLGIFNVLSRLHVNHKQHLNALRRSLGSQKPLATF